MSVGMQLFSNKNEPFVRAPESGTALSELAIALHPAWTGKGIGTAMLTHLIKDACTQYPAIVLTVRADNPAQHLYERFGFVTVGEIENRVKTKSLKMLLKFK